MRTATCSPRVSRAVNGAMAEVSGKQHHSCLGGFSWDQGLDVFCFDARSRKMARELLSGTLEYLDALQQPAAPGLAGL